MTATQTPLRREPCSTRRRRTSIGDARSWRGMTASATSNRRAIAESHRAVRCVL
jgi:hypothetical protein